MQQRLSRLHFVGIGGIGMAALAELLHGQGVGISGSDLMAGATVERLRGLGIPVGLGHDPRLLGKAEAVIRSSAIPDDNPELVAARKKGIPIVGRGALLAEIMRTKDGIAIAGSHGKTTTTAMTAHLLDFAGLDPTALIGGRVPRPDGSASPLIPGRGELLVAEVDESDGSFLLTRPTLAIVTNADPEHLDHHGTRARLLDAFVEFADSVPPHGAAILGIDHPGISEIAPRIKARQIRFGTGPDTEIRAETIESTPGGQRCRVRLHAGDTFEFELPMPGRHNILNALAAIAVGLEKGISPTLLAAALATFRGVSRRFERKGAARGVEVIDDYAHHPAEIRATLAAARSVHPGPITAIFQPHRYTRTRDCWEDFGTAFETADRVILSDIYPASEDPIEGIDAEKLAATIREAGHPDVHFGHSLDEILRTWPARFESGDLVLTLGAGDVAGLGPELLAALEGSPGGHS